MSTQMTFVPTTDTAGTCNRGDLTATYAELVKCFGEPHYRLSHANRENSDCKVSVEWAIKFPDGTISTIYDWKQNEWYCGAEGIPAEQVTEWSIGGNHPESATRIQELVDASRDQCQPPVKINFGTLIDLTAGELDGEGEKICDDYSFAAGNERHTATFTMWVNSEGYRIDLKGTDDSGGQHHIRVDLLIEELRELVWALANFDVDNPAVDRCKVVVDDTEELAINGLAQVVIFENAALERDIDFITTVESLRLAVAAYYLERSKPRG